MQNRRDVLLGLAFALGGASAVAACDGASDDALLKSLRPNGQLQFFSTREYRLVGVIADAIIPRTETPGAIDVGVPAYMDTMIATWASNETKREQHAALEAMQRALGADFVRQPDEERRAAIAAMDAAAYADGGSDEGSIGARYRALKGLIASVYYASEPGATQELQYLNAPGRWAGGLPLSEVGRTWYE